MRARPPLERASPYRERARRRGGAARSQSAGRDEKLVPDIYLTIPGCSDAPRPEVSTADSEEYDPYLTRDNRGTHLLYLPSFKPSLPKTKQKKNSNNIHFGQVTSSAVVWRKVCQCSVPPFGCSCRKPQVVNRFLVRAGAQSTARSLQTPVSTDKESRTTKIWA